MANTNATNTATQTNPFACARTIHILRTSESRQIVYKMAHHIRQLCRHYADTMYECVEKQKQSDDIITLTIGNDAGLTSKLFSELYLVTGINVVGNLALRLCVEMEIYHHWLNLLARRYTILPTASHASITLRFGTPSNMGEYGYEGILESLYVATIDNKDISFDPQAKSVWEVLFSAHYRVMHPMYDNNSMSSIKKDIKTSMLYILEESLTHAIEHPRAQPIGLLKRTPDKLVLDTEVVKNKIYNDATVSELARLLSERDVEDCFKQALSLLGLKMRGKRITCAF